VARSKLKLGKECIYMPAKIVIALMLSVCSVSANTFLFATPAGAKDPVNNNSVDVTALFTFTDGELLITVQNLEADIKAVNQALSSFSFELQGKNLTSVSATGSAKTVTLVDGTPGGYTVSSNPIDIFGLDSKGNQIWGWTVNSGTDTMFGFCDPNCTSTPGPPYTLIGLPNGLNEYTGNASLYGPHNPHLDGTMTFDIHSVGLTNAGDQSVIQNVRLGFGTSPGDWVGAVYVSPEPNPALLIFGALFLAFTGHRFLGRSRAKQERLQTATSRPRRCLYS
jgi:hypothetical protein